MNESPPPRRENAPIWNHPALRFLLVLLTALMVLAGWLAERPLTEPRRAAVAAKAAATAAVAATPAAAPAGSAGVADDLPAAAGLELLAIASEEVPDEDSARHFLLHIPIKARAGAPIDAQSVAVEVMFYDILGGQKVVQTNATVNSHWATPPADWILSDTEKLDVEYRAAKPDASAAAPPEERRYFGYTVRAYYQHKLQAAVAEPGRLAQLYPPAAMLARKSAPVKDPVAEPMIAPALPPTAMHPAPPGGFAGGAMLDLFPVKIDERTDANSIKGLLLHIPIKARRGAQIDARGVVIQVLFYDVVGGETVVPTRATVSTHWAAPPATWVTSDVEELDVKYQLPKPDAQDTPLEENRKYFGYLVRLYYKGKLQAVTAEPERLTQQYPPAATLPEKSTPALSQPSATPAPGAAAAANPM